MTSPAIQAWIDQDDEMTRDAVRRYGWRIIYVYEGNETDPGPAFAYTVGLYGLGHPELLVFSVPPEVAGALLNELGEQIRAGENLLPQREISWERWSRRMITEQVPDSWPVLFEANRFYRRPPFDPVSALQLTYSDEQGRYPDQPGYDGPEQPRPGQFYA
jgi:hypothetical protein